MGDPEQIPEETAESGNRFADLDQLQQEIARRIRDNQRGLERFLQDDFEEEEGAEDAEGDEDYEEL
jgi:Mn-dependent DtxR family transcriptional regulator